MAEVTLNNLLERVYPERFAQIYRDRLREDGRTVGESGTLENFDYYVSFDGQNYVISFDLEEYWKFIEEGVNGTVQDRGSNYSFKSKRLSREAIEKLENWIEIKPVVVPTVNNSVISTEQFAYMLGYSIPRDGIEGKPSLENALFSKEADDLVQLIKEELINYLTELNLQQ